MFKSFKQQQQQKKKSILGKKLHVFGKLHHITLENIN